MILFLFVIIFEFIEKIFLKLTFIIEIESSSSIFQLYPEAFHEAFNNSNQLTAVLPSKWFSKSKKESTGQKYQKIKIFTTILRYKIPFVYCPEQTRFLILCSLCALAQLQRSTFRNICCRK